MSQNMLSVFALPLSFRVSIHNFRPRGWWFNSKMCLDSRRSANLKLCHRQTLTHSDDLFCCYEKALLSILSPEKMEFPVEIIFIHAVSLALTFHRLATNRSISTDWNISSHVAVAKNDASLSRQQREEKFLVGRNMEKRLAWKCNYIRLCSMSWWCIISIEMTLNSTKPMKYDRISTTFDICVSVKSRFLRNHRRHWRRGRWRRAEKHTFIENY